MGIRDSEETETRLASARSPEEAIERLIEDGRARPQRRRIRDIPLALSRKSSAPSLGELLREARAEER